MAIDQSSRVADNKFSGFTNDKYKDPIKTLRKLAITNAICFSVIEPRLFKIAKRKGNIKMAIISYFTRILMG